MSPSAPPYRIISICDDETLSVSREMLLKHEHYKVDSFSSFDHPGIALVQDADLAIFCHTVDAKSVRALRDIFLRHNPRIRFLNLSFVPRDSVSGLSGVSGGNLLRIVEIILRLPMERVRFKSLNSSTSYSSAMLMDC